MNVSPAAFDDIVCVGDTIRVGPRSRAAIALVDSDAVIRIDENTELRVLAPPREQYTLLDLLRGVLHLLSRAPGLLEVRTAFVNALVEGTEVLISVDDAEAFISVFEGRVRATSQYGSLTLTRNQAAVTLSGEAPRLELPIRPRDAVHWALYYPAVLDLDEISPREPGLRNAMESLTKGLPSQAYDQLERVPTPARTGAFYAVRAGLLMSAGRIEEAKRDIAELNRMEPGSAQALSLESVIALSQGDPERALQLARAAVESSPNSTTALLTLAYGQQSVFDLDGALESTLRAADLSPQNALVRARLAELQLSVGDLDRALESARLAAGLNPNLARTQTVLGFAYLAQVKTTESKQAFERAIQLDQAAPLPRLGRGLAEIRDGALETGREQIEVAASLDPNSSLIRSYLGKAYYEERRDKLAASQYELATELDPLDPTPWFYDAIRLQTRNRPVAALRALRKSIELNDNRAVYRSRLLLDQDLAARSASLARIYLDLGFEQAALVEGWRSVSADPSDHAGHRFLADTYATLPRHETARVSELLQSQLLQPLNITPVQPQLAETDLFILEGAGPARPAFNEFNPLFHRNRFAVQANGVVGSNDTWGQDFVHSAIWGPLAYSVGQFHYESDGFRTNNDQDRDIYNLFVQAQISHKTSVQAELRSTKLERGDLELRFPDGSVRPFQDQEDKLDSARLGARHSFGPDSLIIGSLIYGRADGELTDFTPSAAPFGLPVDIEFDLEDRGWTAEAQYQYRADRFRLITGAGYFESEFDERIDLRATVPFPPFVLPVVLSDTDFDIRQTNVYAYSLIDVFEDLTVTVGGSVDLFDGRGYDKNKVNPKVGIAWRVDASTTVRAAAFTTLHRALVSSQTIEPTHVAGFNQLFAGDDGEEAERLGLAVDRTFSGSLYGGLEFSWRDLDVPVISIATGLVTRADRKEQLGRAYLYWSPRAGLALGAEYLFERFDNEAPNFGVSEISEVDTHRVPLSVRYFHPSGAFAGMKATYVDQDGEFGPSAMLSRGDDQFWMVDASVGYRLPGRYGIVVFEVRNLFDEEFNFQDTDAKSPRVLPERFIALRATLSF